MKSIKHGFLVLFICFFNIFLVLPCTTAIISGKYTKDGRPLLWKNRDTSQEQNRLLYFEGIKYNYIGLIDSKDNTLSRVWAGVNNAGFAIMNSLSYNLNIGDKNMGETGNGEIMKMALENCANLEDFENLLNSLPKPLGTSANFGVIDAFGGAAYYETDFNTFVKFDANNPEIAPFGYIIRTNFSFSGEKDLGKGYIRYFNAEELLFVAESSNNLSLEFLIQTATRSFKHSLTKQDLNTNQPKNPQESYFVHFQDFIPRISSSASTVIQGVKPGESPELTTMWTVLGFPLCSVAVPTWTGAGSDLPSILAANETGNAPLCNVAVYLKNKCFPIKRGSGTSYLNLAVLLNEKQTGIIQKLRPLEDIILNETEKKLAEWRSSGFNKNDILIYYKWLDNIILEGLGEKFDFDLEKVINSK